MSLPSNFENQDRTFSASFQQTAGATFGASFNPAPGGGGSGENGATFTPHVSEDGVISWTNDKDLPNPDPVDITGPMGPAGKDGVDGKDGAPGKDGAAGRDGKDGPNGKDGERGTGILRVTTAPQGYILYAGGKFAKKRMALSTICTEAGVSKVLVGDTIAYESEHCHVYYIDSTYAYMDTVVSVRGADGTDGADGKDGAQWYFTQAYEAVLQYGNDGDLSVDLASPNLPVYKVDKANNQMVFTGVYLKGEKGDAGQWHFLETFEMALQYDFVNDGDIVVDLADPRLGIFKVDKVNNQMIFTGAYLKGDKGDPYTLTEADKAEMVASVISALPKYTGEVESV